MELTDAIRRNPMTSFQWVIVSVCILLTMVDGYEILVTAFTLPALTEHFGLTPTEQGLVASFGTLGMGIGAVVLSPLADRVGRRRHILASLALIVVGMTATGLVTTFEQFLAGRFFSGLFLGAIIPSINVLVAEYSNQKRRGAVMGVYGIGLPLGAALGGFLSVALIDAFTWRGPYFFSAIVTAVLALVALVALPESVDFLVQKRPKGALAAYNRIAARIGANQVTKLPVPVGAAPVKGAFVRSVFTGRMLPRTILLWIAYALVIASFYFANGLTAKLVAETTGNADFGIKAQSMVAGGGVVGALLFSLAARRFHPRVVTAALGIVGFAVFVAFASFFDHRTMVLVLAVMVGLAVNGSVAAYYAISPSIYPLAVRAAAVGLMMGAGRAVAFFAPNMATFLQERGFTPGELYNLYGAILALSGVAILLLHATYRGADQRDAMDVEAAVADEAHDRRVAEAAAR
ncbi:MFS transporter [Aeromicrobium sp. 179-A 4D2 NHS]|uniref:MFS transporter n=1 Tax=Aeromicrobium sp. 179-A 4D2 NHS TaxID=3142375 RepID=UPI0039A2EA49